MPLLIPIPMADCDGAAAAATNYAAVNANAAATNTTANHTAANDITADPMTMTSTPTSSMLHVFIFYHIIK
jgi:hypothetical protein